MLAPLLCSLPTLRMPSLRPHLHQSRCHPALPHPSSSLLFTHALCATSEVFKKSKKEKRKQKEEISKVC
jgi:hypothetical protein